MIRDTVTPRVGTVNLLESGPHTAGAINDNAGPWQFLGPSSFYGTGYDIETGGDHLPDHPPVRAEITFAES